MSPGRHDNYLVRSADIQFPLVEHVGSHAFEHAVRLGEHTHSGYELVFVLDGELSYVCQGGAVCTIAGGSYSFMPPGIVHQASGGYENPCVSCWIVFDPSARDAHRNTSFTPADLQAIAAGLEDRETSIQAFDTNTRRTLHRFRMALVNHFSAQPHSASKALLRSIACQLIIDGVRQINVVRQTKSEVYGEAAVTFIRDHLTDPIAVPDIAAHLGFSVSRTYALFREHTGQSPMDYLLRHRVDRAEDMLSHTDRPITDIAFDCGFHSSQYFSRVFRKYRGITPSAFRAREKQTK